MISKKIFHGAIFDVDATLVDTVSVINDIWRAWSIEKGIDFATIYPHIHGRKVNETLEAVDSSFNNEAEIEKVKSIAIEEMSHAKPISGALDFVSKIPINLWGIATSGPCEIARTSISASGFSIPSIMICGEDVENGKPHPEPFVSAALSLGFSPDQCIAFEDSPAGVKSAKDAGCYTVALRTSHADDELSQADTIVNDFNDINIEIINDKLLISFV
ncbi:HAD-IA family hydrolase [Aeromonas encheleia]